MEFDRQHLKPTLDCISENREVHLLLEIADKNSIKKLLTTQERELVSQKLL